MADPGAEIVLRTAFGPLNLVYEEKRLREIRFEGYRRDPAVQGAQIERGTPPDHQAARSLIGELSRYFSGVPTQFSTELDFDPYTSFQQTVWRAAQAIPYGCTLTYGRIASDLGRRDAARAVGAALGQNPFPILIPCHRVLGAGGALTGFAGGLEWKRALLSLENGQKEMF
ncbi:MAG: methylated-DNA--[protein]-cysteine S-methyltransferase [Candidatus Latescibacteria bacterium]|nr:methylated-DNA--[protein]-cysteine S-methyltransferase [Candidatus Latescibacterota bacterium]